MPRTRSAATPPPRRSGTERPRSVRGLTHRPTRSVKKVTPPKKVTHHEPEAVLELVEPVIARAETKQDLIQRHAAARAERHPSNFGPLGIVSVVVTCLVIFVVWWFVPDWFLKPEPIVSTPVVATAPVPTSTAEAALPATQASTSSAATITERRLLLPLSSASSSSQ